MVICLSLGKEMVRGVAWLMGDGGWGMGQWGDLAEARLVLIAAFVGG